MVEEQVVPNSTVDDGVDADAVPVPEDDATPVAIDASSTADIVLDCAQSLLGHMNIADDNNEGQNAVGDTTERAPNIAETEQSDTVILEDTSYTNPPAETTVQESSLGTNEVILVDTIHECKWYKYDNVDHILLNGKVPKKKWAIQLHRVEVLYKNSDIQSMYPPIARAAKKID